jgi:hypothetical protein
MVLAKFAKLLHFFQSLPFSSKDLVESMDKEFGIASESVIQELLKVVNEVEGEEVVSASQGSSSVSEHLLLLSLISLTP